MQDYISERVLSEGEYIAKTKATVRTAAKKFGVGKSTIHKDMTIRLNGLDKELYQRVREVLDLNKDQRHMRGGLATKKKYMLKNEILKEVALTK